MLRTKLLLLLVGTVAACSPKTIALGSACSTASDCGSGATCSGSICVAGCATDKDCVAGNSCTNAVCVPSAAAGTGTFSITSVEGNGVSISGQKRVRSGFVVSGTSLDGTTVAKLINKLTQETLDLVISKAEASTLEVTLPAQIGTWVNASTASAMTLQLTHATLGSATRDVSLLVGEPGVPGNTGPTGAAGTPGANAVINPIRRQININVFSLFLEDATFDKINGVNVPNANTGSWNWSWMVPPDYVPGSDVDILLSAIPQTPGGNCTADARNNSVYLHRPGTNGNVGGSISLIGTGAAFSFTAVGDARTARFRLTPGVPLQAGDFMNLSMFRADSDVTLDTCPASYFIVALAMEYTSAQ